MLTKRRAVKSVVINPASTVAFGRISSRSESSGGAMTGIGALAKCELGKDGVVDLRSYFSAKKLWILTKFKRKL